MRALLLRNALFLPLFAAAGCAAQPESDPPERVEDAPQPINDEIAGGVAEVVTKLMNDPEIARVSYAMVNSGGCSGAMIGPNVLMTAAHCYTADTMSWSFRVYPGKSITSPVEKSFSCTYFLNTFPDSDLLLLWCPSDASGLGPGDIYGYLDFESLEPSSGTEIYSVWTNDIDVQGLPWGTRIYSEGTLQGNASYSWTSINSPAGELYWGYNPVTQTSGWNSPYAPGYAEHAAGKARDSNLYGAPGSSGRPALRASTHRIVLGPLSTAASPEGPSSTALSISDYLLLGNTCDPADELCPGTGANAALLSSFGLNAASYAPAYVDNNVDGVFDLQKLMEDVEKEAPRSAYWLGFTSQRRNLHWSKSSFVSIVPSPGYSHIARSGTASTFATALAHTDLSLPAGTYRMSFTTETLQALYSGALRVCAVQAANDCRILDLDPGVEGAVDHSLRLTVSAGAALRFEVKGGTTVRISDIALAAEGALADFDTADLRSGWENANDGARALVWPDGRTATPSTPDWAGVVRRDAARPQTKGDWPLTAPHLGLDAGSTYQICFQHRTAPNPALTGGTGTVRIMVNGAELAYTTFAPTSTWARKCTASFTPASDGAVLQLGVNSASGNVAQGAYLVDDVEINRL